MRKSLPSQTRSCRAFGQWRIQAKMFGGAECSILVEQLYFVWDAASQSTK